MGITFLDVPVIYRRERVQTNAYIIDCWKCNESKKEKKRKRKLTVQK